MKKIIFILLIGLLVNTAFADKWVAKPNYKNVVIVAYNFAYPGNHLLTLQDGRIYACSQEYWELDNLLCQIRLNKKGTIFELRDDNGNWKKKVGWITSKTKKTAKKTTSKKKTTKEKTITDTTTWTKISDGLPKEDLAVLVKYKDGTLTVAYVNGKKEWKLTTNKKQWQGGDTITTIIEWRKI